MCAIAGIALASTPCRRAYLTGAVAGTAHRFEMKRSLVFLSQFNPQFGGGALLVGIDMPAAK
jgi:hypothetical protein